MTSPYGELEVKRGGGGQKVQNRVICDSSLIIYYYFLILKFIKFLITEACIGRLCLHRVTQPAGRAGTHRRSKACTAETF